ncbi:hypothetical protein [Ornithinibacillus scapharcae]|uniref:hypothetical protein n=1 Tax=Ornithinibacillus scapharcae TaxID=1147159 RepID=UPI000225AAE7|nr:hypothetical protein [Ornithinibacillus scapharcae]
MQTKRNKLLVALCLGFLILLGFGIFILIHDKEEEFTYSNISIPSMMEIGDTYTISYDSQSSKIFNKSNPPVEFWIEEGNDIVTLSENRELSATASGLVVLGIKAPITYNSGEDNIFSVVNFIPIFVNQNTNLDKIFNNQHNGSEFQHIKFDKHVEEIIDSYEEKYGYSITESTALSYGAQYSDYEPLGAYIEIFDEKFGPDQDDRLEEQINFGFKEEFFGSDFPGFEPYLTIFKDNTVVYNYDDTDIYVDVSNIKDFTIEDGQAKIYIESHSHTNETWNQGASDDEIVWLRGLEDCYSNYYFELNQVGVVEHAEDLENDFCE